MIKRCPWPGSDPLYIQYHDHEWGVPLHDERLLFEFLLLEGMQAGLSWITILRKRDHFRRVFDEFDAVKIALYNENKKQQLLSDPGIIRNRLKIEAAIQNARAFLEIKQNKGSFSEYIWQFVDGRPMINQFMEMKEIPATTPASDAISRDLKKRGFKFVGSTICYAFMQAVGMVNDHVTDCYRYSQLLPQKPQ